METQDEEKEKNWNHLPNEMKELVVSELHEADRMSLASCSKNDRHLVSTVPLRILEKVTIELYEDTWEVAFWKTSKRLGWMVLTKSFKTVQRYVARHMKNIEYVGELEINTQITDYLIQLQQGKARLKVDVLVVCGSQTTENVVHYLEQLAPGYLKKISFCSFPITLDILNTQQVKMADSLSLWDTATTAEHLMALENRKIEVMMASFPMEAVDNYLKRQIHNMDERDLDLLVEFTYPLYHYWVLIHHFWAEFDPVPTPGRNTVFVGGPVSDEYNWEINYGPDKVFVRRVQKPTFEEEE